MGNSDQQSKMERYQRMFLDECEENIAALERTLPAMRGGDRSKAMVDDAFRAAHSIKGGAGMVGFARIVPFAHTLESVLDAVRIEKISMSANLANCMLRAVDCLSDLILAVGKGIDLPIGFESQHHALLAEAAGITFDEIDMSADALEPAGIRGEAKNWVIRFRPHANLLRRANDPLLIIRQLREMGKLVIQADTSGLPSFVDMSPTDSYLAWQLELTTSESENAILRVFEFVIDDCDLDVRTASRHPIADSTNVEMSGDRESQIAASLTQNKTIRVDLDRIDRLVNLSGEIAISQALVAQLIDQKLFNEKPALFQELSQLLQHTQNLQDSVMAIRAQPIRTIFDRMTRLVRELGEKTGKQLFLRTSGEATEIDKTVIEQLSDPIVHMIRNSADHGIESADVRLAAGKPAEGVISLSAEQRGSRIVIEVADDGKGIDREAVRRRAIARNLIAPNAELTQDEIDLLIFLPGFTMAESVTDISGRGVGMDVVKRNIQKMGGRISIRSEIGRGSVFTLTLPLTLAVLDGMIVSSGSENYVVPMSSIIECRGSWRKETESISCSGQVMRLRGEYVSVVQMHEVFETRKSTDIDASVAIIVEIEGGQYLALIVDEILGQQQVVIKSVTENMHHIQGIAGATILGNGRVALIVDPTEISQLHVKAKPRINLSSGAEISRRISA
jgi:two-component system, chemotaxis family, sensor kinase CheA